MPTQEFSEPPRVSLTGNADLRNARLDELVARHGYTVGCELYAKEGLGNRWDGDTGELA